jgi:hypothetical protein
MPNISDSSLFLLFSPEKLQRKFLGAASNNGRAKARPYKTVPKTDAAQSRASIPLLRLRKADGLWLSVLTYEEVDLNPFVGTLFVHRQAKITESAALHADTYNGTVADFLRHAAGEEREVFSVVGSNESRFVCGLRCRIIDAGSSWI